MNRKIKWTIAIVLIGIAAFIIINREMIDQIWRTASDNPVVWEKYIREFEKQDERKPVPENEILFIGSSSFTKWKTLDTDMSPLPVHNRGFGGAKYEAILYYMDRIVIKYKPRLIVFYCGDNDMSMGKIKSPQDVLNSFRQFVRRIHISLPQTRIIYISIKPSILRKSYWPKMQEANRLIQAFSATDPLQEYIDTGKVMLDDNGDLRKELFLWDGLHINRKGYELWTGIIKPRLEYYYSH